MILTKPKNRDEAIIILRDVYTQFNKADYISPQGKKRLTDGIDKIIAFLKIDDINGLKVFNREYSATDTDIFDFAYEEIFCQFNIESIEEFWGIVENK